MEADVALAQDELINLVCIADVAWLLKGTTAAGRQDGIKELQQESFACARLSNDEEEPAIGDGWINDGANPGTDDGDGLFAVADFDCLVEGIRAVRI